VSYPSEPASRLTHARAEIGRNDRDARWLRDADPLARGAAAANSGSPKYLYLDMPAWVKLAGVAIGTQDCGNYANLLAMLEQGTKSGRIVCPISDVHLMEVMSIRDPLLREALGSVMVPFSAGWFLRPASEECAKNSEWPLRKRSGDPRRRVAVRPLAAHCFPRWAAQSG
jgi:hypothetical protein